MSRIEIYRTTKDGKRVCIAYGKDHATGYFFQVATDSMMDDENLLYDKDQMFHRLTAEQMMNEIEDQFGIDIRPHFFGVD